jgi:deoxyribonuclease-4
MLLIGSHVSLNGTDMLLGSVKEALSYNETAFMVYTGAPQNTKRRPIEEFKIEEAHQLMQEHNILPEHIVVHAPYIMNLANPNQEKRDFAISFFAEEIRRTARIGSKQIVLHPGAHVKEGSEQGIEYIVDGLNKVIEQTKDEDVLIALETMAGKGTEVGRSFEEIKAIIDGVDDSSRLSVCFDTCHTSDAGYLTRDDFDQVLKQFDQTVGLDKISVLHINDSKNDVGASKDRHENIGFGYIGFDAIHYIVHHPAFTNIPKILETPYITKEEGSKDKVYPPYKFEIEMLKEGIFDPSLKEKIRAYYKE